MRSKKLDTIRTPWPIWDAAKKRCHDEEYRSIARYVNGLMLRDTLSPQPHLFVQAIMNSSPRCSSSGNIELLLNSTPDQIRLMSMRAVQQVLKLYGKDRKR